MENNFKCFRCGESFENNFKSKNDDNLCKYCDEFDDENGEMNK